jgi:hypothetical protein
MTEGTSYCFECKSPLVEIDNRGMRLTGCMTCNTWWSLRGAGPIKLSVEDLAALNATRRKYSEAAAPGLHNPPELARLVVRCLPRSSK